MRRQYFTVPIVDRLFDDEINVQSVYTERQLIARSLNLQEQDFAEQFDREDFQYLDE